MRLGGPAWTTTTVSVLVEPVDAPAFYRTWTGARGARSIHRSARETYRAQFPGCRVAFGRSTSVNSYGAH